MSPTGTEKKRPPPVKVLSSQLRTAQGCGDSYVVRLSKGRSLAASPVWMQGTVLEVQLDRDSLLLMDETGTFTVQGVKSVPRGKPCLSPGTHTSARSVVRGNVALITESSGDIIRTWTHENDPRNELRYWQLLWDVSSERCENAYSSCGWRQKFDFSGGFRLLRTVRSSPVSVPPVFRRSAAEQRSICCCVLQVNMSW